MLIVTDSIAAVRRAWARLKVLATTASCERQTTEYSLCSGRIALTGPWYARRRVQPYCPNCMKGKL